MKYSTTFDRPIWSTASLNGPSASMMRPQCSRLTAIARQVADSGALEEYIGDSSQLQLEKIVIYQPSFVYSFQVTFNMIQCADTYSLKLFPFLEMSKILFRKYQTQHLRFSLFVHHSPAAGDVWGALFVEFDVLQLISVLGDVIILTDTVEVTADSAQFSHPALWHTDGSLGFAVEFHGGAEFSVDTDACSVAGDGRLLNFLDRESCLDTVDLK